MLLAAMEPSIFLNGLSMVVSPVVGRLVLSKIERMRGRALFRA